MTKFATVLALAAALTASTLFSTAGFAEGTADERADCMSDALNLCGQFVPDAKAIAACMAKKKAQLSPACRKHFK